MLSASLHALRALGWCQAVLLEVHNHTLVPSRTSCPAPSRIRQVPLDPSSTVPYHNHPNQDPSSLAPFRDHIRDRNHTPVHNRILLRAPCHIRDLGEFLHRWALTIEQVQSLPRLR